MLIRPERPGDEAVIRALHGAAFDGPDEGRIIDAVRGSADALPGMSLVAEVEGEIVGHCPPGQPRDRPLPGGVRAALIRA